MLISLRKQRHKVKNSLIQAPTASGFPSQSWHLGLDTQSQALTDVTAIKEISSATQQIGLYCTSETEHFKLAGLLTEAEHPGSEKTHVHNTEASLLKICYQYYSFSPGSEEVGTTTQKVEVKSE